MFVVAVFPQNFLMNVQSGDEVEVILDPYPGRLFKAKVDTVITATGEGQFAPSKTIPEASQVGSRGLLAVKISLIDDDRPADVPLGAGGTVAIYTDRGKPVHVISEVAHPHKEVAAVRGSGVRVHNRRRTMSSNACMVTICDEHTYAGPLASHCHGAGSRQSI